MMDFVWFLEVEMEGVERGSPLKDTGLKESLGTVVLVGGPAG